MSKVCSDLEWKVEVDADERLKRYAATQHDSNAAKKVRSKRTVKVKQLFSHAAAEKNDTPKQGGRKRSRPKIAIKRVREERRIHAKIAEEEEARKKSLKNDLFDNHPGNVIAPAVEVEYAAAPEDFFWEVEAVLGRRVHRGRVEYLIRWKGCSEDGNTWEPAANLCDTAMEEAAKFTKRQKLVEKQREEDERKLFGAPEETNKEIIGIGKVEEVGDVPMESAYETIATNDEYIENETALKIDDSINFDSDTPPVDDHLWKWSDADQVIFREVERINVNDPNAAKAVTQARIIGTPVVLVGHVGWANFAKRWLAEKIVQANEGKIQMSKTEGQSEIESGEFGSVSADAATEAGTEGGESSPVSVDVVTEVARVVNDMVGRMEETKATESISEFAAGNEDFANAIDTAAEAVVDEESPVDKPLQEDQVVESSIESKGDVKAIINDSPFDDLLDLSKAYELDIKKMINDVGGEDVPIIKRHYNEEKPIHGKISAEKFLTNCWPSRESETVPQEQDKSAKSQKNSSSLYLHQWQFPLSDTAGRKLCHNNNPLPKGVMGEDLLKYWLDLPQCKLDSPLQYIFMGREDTLSKLHRDPGGLEISIAPIVGEKECVLVHRDDGSNCMYHLTASLEDIDLHRYPLLFQARMWRTVIKPGEILLMPYGTYHQCRNVTPCLSYSRFHLDTVNLLPFVQSMVNGDAPEINHEEVIWNLTSELIKRVDGVFDKVQSRVKAGLDEGGLISGDVVDSVNTLRTLRHFVREVARREEIRQIVKGADATKPSDEYDFGMLVDDVDMCLHEFRYRQSKVVPPFKPRRGKALKNTLSQGNRKNVITRDMSKFRIGSKPVVAFNTSLENNYTSLVNADVEKHFPNASKDKIGESLIGQLVPGDKISVRLEQKHVKAEVIEILPQMTVAYLSFEDYPSVYDEFQPYELLRLSTRAEIPPEDIKPGLLVLDFSNSNEYRARIQYTLNGPMARVKLIISQHEMTRLVSPAMILGRYDPPKKRSKKTDEKAIFDIEVVETKDIAPPTVVNVGQIVQVSRRGAARVMAVHGESVVTHVDVKYLLGNAHTEMVPIESVQLAPELDPDLGRGQRRILSTKRYVSSEDNETTGNGFACKASPAQRECMISPTATDSSCGIEIPDEL